MANEAPNPWPPSSWQDDGLEKRREECKEDGSVRGHSMLDY
jgi:hypothetical protein